MGKINNKNSVLFILGTLGMGGTATSMINLLSLLKEKYGTECDILLFHKDGVYADEMGQKYHILDTDPVLWFLSKDKRTALRERPILSVCMLIIYEVLSLIYGKRYVAREKLYNWRAKKYSRKYKVVIAYQEESVTTFGSFIKAGFKVAWVHNDVDRFPIYMAVGEERLRKTYEEYDKVVCVSMATRNTFLRHFPTLKDKSDVIYNAFMVDDIIAKSEEYKVDRPDHKFVFMSIGRFAAQKRFDKVIEVAEKLKNEGVSFQWYIIGDGEQFGSIKTAGFERQLNDCVILTGGKKNPFPYYRIADYLVISSDYEAHPMVANEALILGTPVISTKLPSIGEIVTDGKNGVIASGMVADDIYEAIRRLVLSDDLQHTVKRGAMETNYSNDHILGQVQAIINEGCSI